jgi:hypothetical protein
MHTAALVPDAAGLVAEVVGTVPHRTRWVEAAAAMAAGSWLEAAARYDAIGSASDAVLATAWAVRSGGADPAHLARVRAFAHRNRAAGLLSVIGRES